MSIILEPRELQFGAVVVDKSSAPVELAVIALEPTGALTIELEGSDEFVLAEDACSGQTLERGQICRMAVVFEPLLPEARTGVVVIDGELAVFGGFGIADRGLDFTPDVLPFGPEDLGDSHAEGFELRNNTGEAIEVTLDLPPTPDSSFTLTSDDCSAAPLANGESCNATVTFSPTNEGSFASSLRALDKATSEIMSSVSMSGEGVTKTEQLDVTVMGPGSIGSVPVGIRCEDVDSGVSDCSASFVTGELVTLSPVQGSLALWGGACAGTPISDPCEVVMGGSQTVTATFQTISADAGMPEAGVP